MDLRELIIYDKPLSDTDVLTVRRSLVAENNAMFAPRVWLQVDTLTSTDADATISSWTGVTGTTINATAASLGGCTLPVVKRDERFPYVRFGVPGSTSTTYGNSLSLGSSTFDIGTSGGFTAIMVIRFYHSAALNAERLFYFANTGPADTISFGRSTTTASTHVAYMVGSSVVYDNADPGPITGAWQVVALRLAPNTFDIWNGEDRESHTGTFTMSNRTFSTMRISRGADGANHSNLDLRELMVWDKPLSNGDVQAVRGWLLNKYGTTISVSQPSPSSPHVSVSWTAHTPGVVESYNVYRNGTKVGDNVASPFTDTPRRCSSPRIPM
eukprot:tig00000459_g1144.t1